MPSGKYGIITAYVGLTMVFAFGSRWPSPEGILVGIVIATVGMTYAECRRWQP